MAGAYLSDILYEPDAIFSSGEEIWSGENLISLTMYSNFSCCSGNVPCA
jgi:hypothetical protein